MVNIKALAHSEIGLIASEVNVNKVAKANSITHVTLRGTGGVAAPQFTRIPCTAVRTDEVVS